MNAAAEFVLGCWVIFFAYWMATAFRTKRTAEHAGWSGTWWMWAIVAGFALARRRAMPVAGGAILWRPTPTLAVLAGVLTGFGLLIALWSRTVLGANWSATVVLKKDHELIERGPYRYVRHPIYTGVLLMILGSAILWGTLVGTIVFGVSVLALWSKARREERLLTSHFPDAYPLYRLRVKSAIIPFLI